MSETASDISKRSVVYHLPGMDDVMIRQDIEYSAAGPNKLTMDLYHPPDQQAADRLPAAIIVAGYPDQGFARVVGCKFKEMGSCVSWGKLIAASGIVGITYANLEPETDLLALLEYIRLNAEKLGIDGNRIGLWAGSGNVPLALSILMEQEREYLKCAVLCYGYTLDTEGASGVADAARQFGFVNPTAGKTVQDMRKDVALFVARAGQDQLPHLNELLDRFVAEALACNLNITVVNHAEGPHAFDLLHDSEMSRGIIRQILAFLRLHLLP
jgi:hypothetical protein